MFNLKCVRYQLVELKVPLLTAGVNNIIPFDQQPQLQSTKGEGGKPVYIKAIELFSNTALFGNPITSSQPVCSPFDVTNGLLTLQENDTDTKKQIPLSRLNNSFASAGAFVPAQQLIFLLDDAWEISWNKSYVTILTTPPVLPYSYLFGVYYSYQRDKF